RGARVTTTASRVSRRTSVTVSGWKRAMRVSFLKRGLLQAFEIVKGFQIVLAAIIRLAGGRSELADLFGMGRAAARAGDGQVRTAHAGDAPGQHPVRRRAIDGRRDAIG